jgi:molybdopterin molybdotransferase
MASGTMIPAKRRMTGFPSLVEVDEALAVVKNNISLEPPEVEFVPLEEAVGRITGRDILASSDVPSFDRSAVDGYAVRASTTTSATSTNPTELEVLGTSHAGSTPGDIMLTENGKAIELFTGSPLPRNADAVVMVEFCKRNGKIVNVTKPVAPWQNVSRKGEDFQSGEIVVPRGKQLHGWHIGALASLNLPHVPVYRKLRMAILSTVNELREPGQELRPGQVVNSTKPMLKSIIKQRGFEAIDLGTVPDEPLEIRNALTRGLASADIIITTGGSSLGEKDLVPDVINEMGKPGLLIHGVRMRPGKPTGIAVVQGKPVFVLSGYPVAALVAFEVFVEPISDMILGVKRPPQAKILGHLTRRVTTPVGVRSYVRVKVTHEPNGSFKVDPLRLTGSGILSSMTKANGILIIPEGTEGFDEEEQVEVILIDAIEASNKERGLSGKSETR